jgi:riboflavin synthase
MFTGIVQDVGQIVTLERRGGDVRLRVAVDRLSLATARAGDSIAVSGVCLTALDIDAKSFSADVSNETLSLTTLGALEVGSRVNLEPALKAGDALGGHLVSGHVDGLGEVLDIRLSAVTRQIFRAEGLGGHRWRESNDQRSGRDGVFGEPHSAHASGDDAR